MALGETTSYGRIVLEHRKRLNLTQRELAQRVGCTDGYIAHVERELKVPSLDICLALAHVFQFSLEQQHAFLDAVESARVKRADERMRARGAKIRGALQTRGAGGARPGRHAVEERLEPAHIARDLAADPDLREAYDNLKTALHDPNLREAVLNTLRALAQSAKQR